MSNLNSNLNFDAIPVVPSINTIQFTGGNQITNYNILPPTISSNIINASSSSTTTRAVLNNDKTITVSMGGKSYTIPPGSKIAKKLNTSDSENVKLSDGKPNSILPIDDDLLILYQWANYYGTPLDYLYFKDAKGKNVIDLTNVNIYKMEDFIKRMLGEKYKLHTITKELDIPPDKAAMLYTKIFTYYPGHLPYNPWENQLSKVSTTDQLINELNKIVYNFDDNSSLHKVLLLYRLFGKKIDGKIFTTDSALDVFEKSGEPKITQLQFAKLYKYAYKNIYLDYAYEKLYALINQFYVNVGSTNKYTLPSFKAYYTTWNHKYETDILDIRMKTDKMITDRNRIIISQPLMYSKFDKDKVQLYGKGKWNIGNWAATNKTRINIDTSNDGHDINIYDGYKLFDMAQSNVYVPYIRYNVGNLMDVDKSNYNNRRRTYKSDLEDKSERSLSKVYDDGSFEPDYNNIILDDEKTDSSNNIYMTIWLGEGSKSVAPKDSYTSARYDLTNNKLEVNVSVKNESNISHVKEKLSETLPIRLNEWIEGKMSGNFNIYNLDIEEYSMLYAVRIYSEFINYFYIEELDKPSASKTQMYLHFRSPLEANGIYQEIGFKDKVKELSNYVDIHDEGRPRISFKQLHSMTGEKFDIANNFNFTGTINDEVGTSGSMDIVSNNSTNTIVPYINTPYVKFKILNAPSKYELNRLSILMSYLMGYYNELKPNIIETNRMLLQGILNQDGSSLEYTSNKERNNISAQSSGSEIGSSITGESINEQLRKLRPDIFIGNYSTLCQKGHQPLPINPYERTKWENNMFSSSGKMVKRQVISYPPMDPNPLTLVCPNDDYPYPGFIANTLTNNDKYPCLPCCYNKDHINNPGSTYNRCMNNWEGLVSGTVDRSVIKSDNRRDKHVVNINKRAQANRLGALASNINKLLKSLNNDDADVIYKRYGMPQGPNSLIHSILFALDDYDTNIIYKQDVRKNMLSRGISSYYHGTKNMTERELIVQIIRADIAMKINTTILKQENYDISAEHIRRQLANNNLFLDPARYYRALEDYFNITLFVFANKVDNSEQSIKKTDKSDTDGNSLNQLEIPRHTKNYVRRRRPINLHQLPEHNIFTQTPPMILIFKFLPTYDRGVYYQAHCELITRNKSDKASARFYSHSFINNMFDIFYKTSSIIQWSMKPTCHISSIQTLTKSSQIFKPITNDSTQLTSSVSTNAPSMDIFGDCDKEGLIVERSLNDGDFSDLKATIEISTKILDNTLFKNSRNYSNTYLNLADSSRSIAPISRLNGQVIDDYGKCIILEYVVGNFNMLAIVMPVQPYDLKEINISINSMNLPSFKEINEYIHNVITGITYSKMNRTNNGQRYINGLWYSAYGRIYGVYIPIKDELQTGDLVNLPLGKLRPPGLDHQAYNKISQIQLLSKLEKLNMTILSIIEWLFKMFVQTSISNINSNINSQISSSSSSSTSSTYIEYLNNQDIRKSVPNDYEKFANEFIKLFVIPNNNFDPIEVYNFDYLNYKYPKVNSFDDALKYISANTKGIIYDTNNFSANNTNNFSANNSKILLYNRSYYDSMVFFIKDVAKQNEGLVMSLPMIISGSYTKPTDFRQDDNVLVFLDKLDLNEWMKNKTRTIKNNLLIRTKLSITMANAINPYLFNNADNNGTYLIQNVDNSDVIGRKYDKMLLNNPEYNPDFTSGVQSILGYNSGIQSINILGRSGASTSSRRVKEYGEMINRNRKKFIGISRAISVALQWRNKRINMGYNTPIIVDKFPSFILYEIIEGRSIKIKERRINSDEKPLEILTYGSEPIGVKQESKTKLNKNYDIYAAMLRIA